MCVSETNGTVTQVKKRGRPKGRKDSKPRKEPRQRVNVPEDQRIMATVVDGDGKTVKEFRALPFADSNEMTAPGDNARYLQMTLKSLHLPKVDINDPSQVEKRIYEYFEFCFSMDRKPSMIGMANWLGVDLATVSKWKSGDRRPETMGPVIQRAMLFMEEMWVDYMQSGKINPASGIFLGVNLYGYRNQQDVVITPNANPLENLSDTGARGRLLDAIPADDSTVDD